MGPIDSMIRVNISLSPLWIQDRVRTMSFVGNGFISCQKKQASLSSNLARSQPTSACLWMYLRTYVQYYGTWFWIEPLGRIRQSRRPSSAALLFLFSLTAFCEMICIFLGPLVSPLSLSLSLSKPFPPCPWFDFRPAVVLCKTRI